MKVSDMAKRMIGVICVSFLVLIAASALYYRSFACLPFVFGAFLGTALNIFKVIMLERTVKKASYMEKEAAGNYITLQHFLRFLLTGVILVLSALLPIVNVWGTAAGVLTFQLAAFSLKHFSGRSNA